MSNLNLSEAFAQYGAKLVNPQWAVSDITEDGVLVMSCWFHYIKTFDGIWRYVDTLSRWNGNTAGNNLCRQHVEDAFKNNRPVRIVIARTEETAAVDSGQDASKVKKEFYTKPEMIGRITNFDGDKFTIDFKRSRD